MNIDLSTLKLGKLAEEKTFPAEDGVAVIVPYDNAALSTAGEYTLPLKVTAVAKTDSTNIRLYFARGEVILNWECMPSELRIHDILTGEARGFPETGEVPVNEFAEIVWIVGRDKLELYVNGELRHAGSDYAYIRQLAAQPDKIFRAPIQIGSAWGSTVTVKALTVEEI
ncbi:MAG: LamG domain-containing protein [Oscillospiraceae bacterium]|nr:LamG domain-containing protein [Oscillospiraceae bacterium]